MLFLFFFIFLFLSLSWERRIGISRHIWFIKPDRTLLHRILLRSRSPRDISAYLVSDKELSFGFPDKFCRIFWNIFATTSFFGSPYSWSFYKCEKVWNLLFFGSNPIFFEFVFVSSSFLNSPVHLAQTGNLSSTRSHVYESVKLISVSKGSCESNNSMWCPLFSEEINVFRYYVPNTYKLFLHQAYENPICQSLLDIVKDQTVYGRPKQGTPDRLSTNNAKTVIITENEIL